MGFRSTITTLTRKRPRRRRSGLDAEAEANHWLVRLGGGLAPPDARTWATADEHAGQALTSAAECHRTARVQLAAARTAEEYEQVTRTAREGLRHLGTARLALGPVPQSPVPQSPVSSGGAPSSSSRSAMSVDQARAQARSSVTASSPRPYAVNAESA